MHDGQLPPPGTRRLITGEGPQRNGQQGRSREAGWYRASPPPAPTIPPRRGREGGRGEEPTRLPPPPQPQSTIRGHREERGLA